MFTPDIKKEIQDDFNDYSPNSLSNSYLNNGAKVVPLSYNEKTTSFSTKRKKNTFGFYGMRARSESLKEMAEMFLNGEDRLSIIAKELDVSYKTVYKFLKLFIFESLRTGRNIGCRRVRNHEKGEVRSEFIRFLEEIKWDDGVFCPHCFCGKYYILKEYHNYRCANSSCKKDFNILTNTLLANTKLKYSVWLRAYEILEENPSIPSTHLAKKIETTQATAWWIIKKIKSSNPDGKISLLNSRPFTKESYQKTIQP